MKSIYLVLIVNPKVNKEAAGNPQGQPEDIDDRKGFAFQGIPPGDFQIIPDHGIIIFIFFIPLASPATPVGGGSYFIQSSGFLPDLPWLL